MSEVSFSASVALAAMNGGLFISGGVGRHPVRRIDTHELILVRSGVLEIYEENQHFAVGSGQVLLLLPGREHGGLADYPGDLSFYWIHFDLGEGGPCLASQVTTLASPERLEELLRRFLDDQETGRLTQEEASLLVTLMLCEVMNGSEKNHDSPGVTMAESAKQFITTHFNECISTTQVAEALGCNPDYLGRVFKRHIGMPILNYLHRERMYEARRLLMNSTLNVNEIAMNCGYEDVGYFRRMFKRINKLTARQYRKLHTRVHINVR